MPQVVDLEALVCGSGCGEGKVACETLAGAAGGIPKAGDASLVPPPPDDPDLPAESFRLPREDVIDWVSRNAAAAGPYDREESTRGGAHPKSAAHHHSNPKLPQLRFAKPKGLIIGLPNKIQSSGYIGQSARRAYAGNGRFFPKNGGDQSAGSGRSAVTEMDPTSPKVSCFGRVLADQDQGRRRRAATTPGVSRESSSVADSSSTGAITGFWASLLGLSCCAQRRDAALLGEEPVSTSWTSPSETNGEARLSVAASRDTVTSAPVPGLGGMGRFASGRRSASWGGNLELEVEEDAAGSGPSPQRILPGRRSVGSPADVDRDREWESAGSAYL